MNHNFEFDHKQTRIQQILLSGSSTRHIGEFSETPRWHLKSIESTISIIQVDGIGQILDQNRRSLNGTVLSMPNQVT